MKFIEQMLATAEGWQLSTLTNLPKDIPPIGVNRPMPDDPDYLKFRFKPPAEMTEADYQRIGFRSGLEIHQQLLTTQKLFCHCPAGHYSDHFHAEILRHMRPTLSELGEYDGTALMEFKTRKEIIYHINRDTICTYEMDDTPPFELNEQALDIALEIALLYNCTLVDEIHIARKQYLDGSIPTGFQRTTIVGVDGSLPYGDRRIDVIQLGLEEDSCREVSDVGHRRTYLTDRLGMPLIETVTAPQMTTPDEVAEVGEIIRKLTRSTGKVRTGMGAARQDVNVSVHGGTRIEIKGVPKLQIIPLLTYNEALRQFNLLRLRAELHRRGITAQTFKAITEDVTKIVRKSRYQPIRDAVALGHHVKCVMLKGFHKLLHWPTQTDTVFGREVADRVQVIACLTTLPNIVHSDSHTDFLATSEWASLRKAVGGTEDDTLVLVWGPLPDVALAASEIETRALEATIGIPSETRQAMPDGTNGFERILPGPNRMYPDTDLPPKRVTDQRVATITAGLPDYFWELEAWFTKLEVPTDCITSLAISPLAPLFKRAVKEWKLDPKLAAVTLIQIPRALVRKGVPINQIGLEDWTAILSWIKAGRPTREGICDVVRRTALAGSFDELLLPDPAADTEVKIVIDESIAHGKQVKAESPEAKHRAAMGYAMERLIGRYPGVTVAELIEAGLK